jgi:4-hydroxyphenylpyruvate dioxygenase
MSRIEAIDHLGFIVGDAAMTARFFCNELGFRVIAELADQSEMQSLVMAQRDIRLVFSSPLSPTSLHSDHLRLHGSGVRDIAFATSDVRAAYRRFIERGARSISEPRPYRANGGVLWHATVGSFCDSLVHSLIQRDGHAQAFWPGHRDHDGWTPSLDLALDAIDHIAICTDWDQLDEVTGFFARVFDFEISHEEDVATEHTGMKSRVMQSVNQAVRLVFMEPVHGARESQIAEYLRHYGGPGVQHVAFHTGDIMAASHKLRDRHIPFLHIPATYYDQLEARIGQIPYRLDQLCESNVLVDRERDGLLLQAFTRPIYARPTFFCELIQRRGALGFGSGNIAALFRAVEADRQRGVGHAETARPAAQRR